MDWNNILLALVNASVPVIIPLIPVLLASLLGLFIQQIRLVQAKIEAQYPTQDQIIDDICAKAVVIAEQMQIGGFINDRKAYAVKYVQDKLDAMGIKIDVSEVEQEIERAVYLELQKSGTVTTTTTPAIPPVAQG